jgi:hypothetical protein
MEMEMDKNNYELYYNKSKNLNNFNDYLEMYNIRHIEWNINNIEHNQKSQEYLKNFSNTIIKMKEPKKIEILIKIYQVKNHRNLKCINIELTNVTNLEMIMLKKL